MSNKLSKDDRALEALIVMALRLDNNREITEEDIAEENLPELTEEEIEYFSERGPQILRNVLAQKQPTHRPRPQGASHDGPQ